MTDSWSLVITVGRSGFQTIAQSPYGPIVDNPLRNNAKDRSEQPVGSGKTVRRDKKEVIQPRPRVTEFTSHKLHTTV